jgi:hypothetical protein
MAFASGSDSNLYVLVGTASVLLVLQLLTCEYGTVPVGWF